MDINTKFLVNWRGIREELIDSNVLVVNRIEPYYSLSCLRGSDYNTENCLVCPRFEKKCHDIFVNGGYIEENEY